MRIQCLHCGSEQFYVVITDEGRSELRCIRYDDHITESEAEYPRLRLPGKD